MTRTLVLASHNAHKLDELRRILDASLRGIELVGYDGPEPIEDGLSFEENALIKARAAAEHTGLPAIADDSGITVNVLGGMPGIFSARWAGPARDDRANLELLLHQLSDLADAHRAAAFVCAAALVLPGGDEYTTRGIWPGTLLRSPRGEHGFGYDPIFQPEHHERSAAELSSEEKNAQSHRTRAFTEIAPLITQHVAS
jgi:XTP/dITP diphosphohydrolase